MEVSHVDKLKAPHISQPRRALLQVVSAPVVTGQRQLAAASPSLIRYYWDGQGSASDTCACRAASCNGIRLRRLLTALAMALPSARMASAFRCALGLNLWQRNLPVMMCHAPPNVHHSPVCQRSCLHGKQQMPFKGHSGPHTFKCPIQDNDELRCACAGPCQG